MDHELGARIRTLRKERGLSQEALAQALEVSRQAVTKWEDGSSLPSTANLFALSGFFGVPLAELTGTPEGAASLPNAASISKKQRRIRAKVLKIGAWVLLAVSVFGYFGGILGMLLAVPIAGIIQVFVVKWAESREIRIKKSVGPDAPNATGDTATSDSRDNKDDRQM